MKKPNLQSDRVNLRVAPKERRAWLRAAKGADLTLSDWLRKVANLAALRSGRPVRKTWVIRHDNGTYYRGMAAVGPCFGASAADAFKFHTRMAAIQQQGIHFAFGDTEIEEYDE